VSIAPIGATVDPFVGLVMVIDGSVPASPLLPELLPELPPLLLPESAPPLLLPELPPELLPLPPPVLLLLLHATEPLVIATANAPAAPSARTA